MLGAREREREQGMLPDIKKHIGLLIQYRSDVTVGDEGIIHLVPLPITGLQENKEERFSVKSVPAKWHVHYSVT